MARLGDGGGSGYPAVIDTTTTEINDPGGTLIDADKVNDVTDAIIKIQAELGIDPAGTLATLLARLAVQHTTSGTHSAITLTGKMDEAQGADIASAATTDIGAATGNYVEVTGTTTITGLGTVQAGTRREVRFTGILILTQNATSLILPSGADIVTAAGDSATFISLGSGNWVCVSYQSTHLTLGTKQGSTSGTAIDFTGIPTGVKRVTISFKGVSLSGTDSVLIQLGDSVGFEVTGYLSDSSTLTTSVLTVTATAGLIMRSASGGNNIHGIMILTRMDGNHLWAESHSARMVTSATITGGGTKTISAELTQIRITRNGSNTFDAGSINIMYE